VQASKGSVELGRKIWDSQFLDSRGLILKSQRLEALLNNPEELGCHTVQDDGMD
jgi:hypothetical protein